MSWGFAFVARSNGAIARNLDTARQSQGGQCPDQLIDAIGSIAENTTRGEGKGVCVSSQGYIPPNGGGHATFKVQVVDCDTD